MPRPGSGRGLLRTSGGAGRAGRARSVPVAGDDGRRGRQHQYGDGAQRRTHTVRQVGAGGEHRAGDGDAECRADLPGRGAEAGAEPRPVRRQGRHHAEGERGHAQPGAGRDHQQPPGVHGVGRVRAGGGGAEQAEPDEDEPPADDRARVRRPAGRQPGHQRHADDQRDDHDTGAGGAVAPDPWRYWEFT